MSRTYRFPLDRVANLPRLRTNLFCDRLIAIDEQLTAHGCRCNNHAQAEIAELVIDRGCPPAKAVSIVTGSSVSRLARLRLVA